MKKLNKKQLRQTQDYKDAVQKIKDYRKGFTFTINFSQIPKAKANALKVILHDCCEEKILESISIGVAITGEWVDETFRRV